MKTEKQFKLKALTKKRLLFIANVIEEHWRTFDIREWSDGISFNQILGKSSDEENCGTAGCIAGYACVLFGKRTKRDKNLSITGYQHEELPNCEYIDVRLEGSALLGLDTQFYVETGTGERKFLSDKLFIPYQWPFKFYLRLERLKSQKSKARLTANYIRYFVEKDGNV